MKELPLGTQSFPIIVNNNYLYVDKTPFALNLIQKGRHYFLSRPRRFGKSLFLSTLKHIFLGDKELFKGLAIYESGYKWEKHPVLHLSFSNLDHSSAQSFEEDLNDTIEEFAGTYQLTLRGRSIQKKLSSLIKELAKKNPVVVLIDEYDKPILDHLEEPKVMEANRKLLRAFFSTLKEMDEYLRFTFVTGVSRFSKASLFSGFNNLTDISFDEEYAAITGYTEEELDQCFEEHIDNYTALNKTTQEATRELMRRWYNGYRFSDSDLRVYNPYSTLSFLSKHKARNYWYNTGTPDFLITLLAKNPKELLEYSYSKATFNTLTSPVDVEGMTPISLMYQSGYLTIKGVTESNYILDFPNREVRESLFENLLILLSAKKTFNEHSQVRKAFEEGDMLLLIKLVNDHFAKLPYPLFDRAKEGFFHALFLSIIQLSGLPVHAEVHTNIGRIDMVVETEKAIYIIECKLDKSAKEAMNQIKDKNYLQPFFNRGKEIKAFGLNFSCETRNISDHMLESYSQEGRPLKTI